MSRFANYSPACYERNCTMANIQLTLDGGALTAAVSVDTGQLIKSVVWDGVDLTWVIEFNDKWSSIYPQITLGTGTTTTPQVGIVDPSVSSLSFAQYDHVTSVQIAESGEAYISLRLNA